ncbi:MAG: hypothetical protein DYG83_12935 [Candidatus Brocadia sp. AMX2]|nr:hypothetical protein [Candidatus Brocadia sp. AMX2]
MLTNKNPRSTKKEEGKSYLIIFVVVSFILVGVTAWVIVNETVDRRPWKKYQRQFYRLEYEKVKQNYEKERANFESPDVQTKYRETKNNLERAWEEFKKPSIQNEYKKLSEEQKTLNNELETQKFQAIVARNENMEKEYLYGKTQSEQIRREIEESEEKGKEFTAKMKDLEGKIAPIKEIYGRVRCLYRWFRTIQGAIKNLQENSPKFASIPDIYGRFKHHRSVHVVSCGHRQARRRVYRTTVHNSS